MVIAGKYESQPLIGWSDDAEVRLGPADPARKFPLAVKILREGASDPDRFLSAARDQEAIAKAGCRWVAPIFEAGKEGERAYYVTRQFPRTLAKIIQGKITVDAAGLQQIAGSTLQGLAELRDKHGRAHGNLKPSNVFLEGSGALRNAAIVLGDLAPHTGMEGQGRDCHELGAILYQLIRGRSVQRLDWPFVDGPDWQRLGGAGSAWLDFCNQLMDPALRGRDDALATAQQAFAQLGRGPSAARKGSPGGIKRYAFAAIAGIAGIAGVGGTTFYLRGRQEKGPSALPAALSIADTAVKAGDAGIRTFVPPLKPRPMQHPKGSPALAAAPARAPIPSPSAPLATPAKVQMAYNSVATPAFEPSPPAPTPAASAEPAASPAPAEQLQPYLDALRELKQGLTADPAVAGPVPDANDVLNNFRNKPLLRDEAGNTFMGKLPPIIKIAADEPLLPAYWTKVGAAGENNNTITYKWKGVVQMDFTKVPASPNEKPFYLSKTTVPVLFAAYLERELRLSLQKPSGPVAWALKNGVIAPAVEWVEKSTHVEYDQNGNPSDYFAVNVPPPQWSSPMTGITVSEAKQFAQAAGCQLPSKSQWIDVMNSPAGQDWIVHWSNLAKTRNSVWQTAERNIIAMKSHIGLRVPSSGCFYNDPTKLEPVNPSSKEPNLFFDPVEMHENKGFCSLIGNVGQYLADETTYFLAGGSSQAPPSAFQSNSLMNPEQVQRSSFPYADAGFRLAAPVRPPDADDPSLAQLKGNLDEEIDRVQKLISKS